MEKPTSDKTEFNTRVADKQPHQYLWQSEYWVKKEYLTFDGHEIDEVSQSKDKGNKKEKLLKIFCSDEL